MKTAEELKREFAEKMAYMRASACYMGEYEFNELVNKVLSDINALINAVIAERMPTEEDAEEILDKQFEESGYDITNTVQRRWVLLAMTEFATLHAQQLADKIIAERMNDYYPKEEAGYPEKFISHMLMYKTFRDCFTQLYNHWDGHKYLEFKTLDELFNYWKENER